MEVRTERRTGLKAVAIVVVLLAGITAAWLYGRATRAPRLAVSDLDLGILMPGRSLERVIPIENQGRQALIIHQATACCGMSLPYGFPSKIAPESTGYIVARFRTPAHPTASEWKITLRTNDPMRPVSVISLRSRPDKRLTVLPARIDLGHVVAASTFRAACTIRTAGEVKGRYHVATSSPAVTASLRTATNDATVEIDLQLSESAARGELQEYLYVKTGLPSRPNVVIPVSATIEKGLRPRPEQVYFGLVSGAQVVVRRVGLEIIGPGWDTVEIEPLGCDALDATIEPRERRGFELCVSLDPTKMSDVLKRWIVLRGSSDDTLRIAVIAARKRSGTQARRP